MHRPGLTADRAIAQDPHDGRWLSFEEPIETLVAWDLDEVSGVVAAAEGHADAGRWVVGFVSYDAAPAFDRALHAHRNERVPLAAFGVYTTAVDDPLDSGFHHCGTWTDTVDAQQFQDGVRSVKEHIAAGDTYQVNLTYRSAAPFDGAPLGLFRSLMDAQRAPYGVYLDLGPYVLCSASPELFLHRARVDDHTPVDDHTYQITSLPMKGTRPRGDTPELDEAMAAELAASAKDRAENTMIVDMMRNDLGRVAEIGSLDVPALHTVERYPTVLHLTSTVTARSTASLPEVFAATFPPASITGAPKVRTSQLITELEATPRGVYCGTAGILTPNGVAQFNVAIRTVWIDRAAGTATYGTGGGIVWDSDPADEWQETKVKTRVLDRACEPIELIETMSWLPGLGISNLDRHLERLERSALALDVPVDLDAIVAALATIESDEPLRVRMLVAPDGSFDVSQAPMPDPVCRPWTAVLADTPIRSTDPALRHKSTMRHVYEHHRSAHPDADEVILWNERGELTETTIGNLVLERGGRLSTPIVDSGLLPGTFRADLVAHDKVIEARLFVDDLATADAIFMINAVRGWVPLELAPGSVDRHRVGVEPVEGQ